MVNGSSPSLVLIYVASGNIFYCQQYVIFYYDVEKQRWQINSGILLRVLRHFIPGCSLVCACSPFFWDFESWHAQEALTADKIDAARLFSCNQYSHFACVLVLYHWYYIFSLSLRLKPVSCAFSSFQSSFLLAVSRLAVFLYWVTVVLLFEWQGYGPLAQVSRNWADSEQQPTEYFLFLSLGVTIANRSCLH